MINSARKKYYTRYQSRCIHQSLTRTSRQDVTWWQWLVIIECCNAVLIFELATQKASR